MKTGYSMKNTTRKYEKTQEITEWTKRASVLYPLWVKGGNVKCGQESPWQDLEIRGTILY